MGVPSRSEGWDGAATSLGGAPELSPIPSAHGSKHSTSSSAHLPGHLPHRPGTMLGQAGGGTADQLTAALLEGPSKT